MPRDLRRLLDAVDLEQLADQLLGGHRGHGRGARWPSPVPDHPQTGQSPPMSIFTDRTGVQRWTCWATGSKGTAIDLLIVNRGMNERDAIDWLDTRYGLERFDPQPVARKPPPAQRRQDASKALLRYVTGAEQRFWHPAVGTAVRDWLIGTRKLNPDVVRANRIGFDPGPDLMPRARGLPKQGPGLVLPTFNSTGQVVYAQVRYGDRLAERCGRKYDNPTATHGTKPTVAWPQPPFGGRQPAEAAPLLVCEGVIDALTVTGVGLRSVALIAAGDAEAAATELARVDAPLVLAVDADSAGDAARSTLAERLHDLGRRDVRHLTVSDDINAMAQRCGPQFAATLHAALGTTQPRSKRGASAGAGR